MNIKPKKTILIYDRLSVFWCGGWFGFPFKAINIFIICRLCLLKNSVHLWICMSRTDALKKCYLFSVRLFSVKYKLQDLMSQKWDSAPAKVCHECRVWKIDKYILCLQVPWQKHAFNACSAWRSSNKRFKIITGTFLSWDLKVIHFLQIPNDVDLKLNYADEYMMLLHLWQM